MALKKFSHLINPGPQGLAPGDYRIDWANPISKDLSFACLLNGIQTIQDIVAGARADLNFTTLSTPLSFQGLPVDCTSFGNTVPDVTPYGPGLKFGTLDLGKFDFGLQQAIIGGGMNGYDFTILVIANPLFDTSGSTPALFSQRQQSSFPQIDIFANSDASNNGSGGDIALYIQSQNGIDTLSGPFHNLACDGNYHVYVARQYDFGSPGSPSAIPAIWVDGVLGGSGVANTVPPPVTTGQKLCIGGLADANVDQYAGKCTIVLVMVWNRGLFTDEITAISLDPFQLFAPAEFDLPVPNLPVAATALAPVLLVGVPVGRMANYKNLLNAPLPVTVAAPTITGNTLPMTGVG